MSKSYTMDELISGYFEKQFAEADEVPLPKFSFRHRLTMKRIFKLFEHNKAMSMQRTLAKMYWVISSFRSASG